MTQKIFWAADYEGACIDAKSKNMIFDFLQYIMHPTRYKKIVYFHNLAGFDGPILFEQLMNFEGIKFVPLIHNGT
jgi:hypothetical protein